MAAPAPGQALAVVDTFERLRALRCRDGWGDPRTQRRAVGLLRADGERVHGAVGMSRAQRRAARRAR